MKLSVFKKKAFTFIPFIGLAILFWVSSILTKKTTYTKDIWIEVVTPDSLILLDSNFYIANLTLSGKGLDLISVKSYNQSDPLKVFVNLNDNILSKEKIRNYINQEINNSNIDIGKVIFNSKKIKVEPKIFKTVPIKFSGEVQFKKLFGLKSKIELNPNKIVISGPKSIVEKIKKCNTLSKKYTDIQENISEDIELLKPKSKNIKFEFPKVHILIQVEELTEKKIILPVKIEGKRGENIKIVPSNIEVSFMVGISKYDKINSKDFSATIYLNKEDQVNSNFPVSIVKKPSDITIQYIQPNYVDVYIQNEK